MVIFAKLKLVKEVEIVVVKSYGNSGDSFIQIGATIVFLRLNCQDTNIDL